MRRESTEGRRVLRKQLSREAEKKEEKTKVEEEYVVREERLVDSVYGVLDQLTRQLLRKNTILEGETLGQLEAILKRVQSEMKLEELHHLEYSNRMSYILQLVNSKHSSLAHKESLLFMVEKQLERVEQLYISHFNNYDSLKALQLKYQRVVQ